MINITIKQRKHNQKNSVSAPAPLLSM